VELAISRALARLAAPGEGKTDHVHEHVDVDVVVHVHVVGCLRLFENPGPTTCERMVDHSDEMPGL
jgi:hypothetical protein